MKARSNTGTFVSAAAPRLFKGAAGVFFLALIIGGVGCAQPEPVDPDYSEHFQGALNWRYHVEKKIKAQFAAKGLIETTETPDVIAIGIIGVWNKIDDWYWVERRPLKIIQDFDTQQLMPHDGIYGKIETQPEFNRCAWKFIWSFVDEKKDVEAVIEESLRFYLKEMHKK